MKNIYKFTLLLWALVLVLPLVLSYEIICSDDEYSGVKFWNYNVSLDNENLIFMEVLKNSSEFENCTFIYEKNFTETPEEPDSRIIGMLNNNILKRNEEIERLKGYRVWMYIFMVTIILLVLINIKCIRDLKKQ